MVSIQTWHPDTTPTGGIAWRDLVEWLAAIGRRGVGTTRQPPWTVRARCWPSLGRPQNSSGDMPSDDDVPALIRDALAGDDRAFAQLIRLHKERVVRLAARFARNTADLDEIAQDVFLHVHRSLHRYRAEAPFAHWVGRIATRRCHDYLRRIYRRRWWTSLDALREQGFEPTPESGYQDTRIELLRHALHTLHPDHQTILTMLELNELSVKETSALTGWSESNVKVRAHRARHALRAKMERMARTSS